MSIIFNNFWKNVVGLDKPLVRPRIVLRPRREENAPDLEPESETMESDREDESLAAELAALEQQADAAQDTFADANRQAELAEMRAQEAFQKAEVMGRLAALTNPYRQAIAAQGPDFQQLQMLFGMVKASLGQKQFSKASEALDLMEAMLNSQQKITPAAPEYDLTPEYQRNADLADLGGSDSIDFSAQPAYPAAAMEDYYQAPAYDQGMVAQYPEVGSEYYQAPGYDDTLVAQDDSQALFARITSRVDGLAASFRQAILNQSPDAGQLQSAFDTVKSCVASEQFQLAEEWLDYMEQLLAQQSFSPLNNLEYDMMQANHSVAGVVKAGRPDVEIPVGNWNEEQPSDEVQPGGSMLARLQSGQFEDEGAEEEAQQGLVDPFTPEVVPVPPPMPVQPLQAVNANCSITVTNNTKVVLTLLDQSNLIGDFMTNPANSIQPGGSTSFVFVHTPGDNDPANAGCAGSLTWQVGDPLAATWLVKWDNIVGQKNEVAGEVNPQTAGFQSLEQIGQGDENVPVNFTISGGIDVPAPPVPAPAPVPPPVLGIVPLSRIRIPLQNNTDPQ